MKIFIYRLACFVLIFLTFIGLTETVIYYKKNDFFSEKNLSAKYKNISNSYKWISKVNPQKKILLFGSSTVAYGLSCSKLNEIAGDTISFVNLASVTRCPIQSYFILKKIDLTGVKTAYYGIDPWIFTKEYYKSRDPYYYLDMNLITALKYAEENGIGIISLRYQGLFKYLLYTLNLTLQHNSHLYDIPEDYGTLVLQDRPVNFNGRAGDYFKIEKYGWSELQFEYLVKILDLFKEKKIDFKVFLPPKRSNFSKDYKSNCTVIHNEFMENLSKVNFSAPVFGKFDQLDTLGDYELFSDDCHLNAIGQGVYSKLFYDMIKTNIYQKFDKHYSWFIKEK
jgi:hypothetical protein